MEHTFLSPDRAPADLKVGKYDFSGEVVHWEGPPHRGDIAVNVALGTTLLWLPLTVASITRGAFVNYCFTDKRLSVITTAPWKSARLTLASRLCVSQPLVLNGNAYGDHESLCTEEERLI